MSDCLFCNIVEGKIPAKKVFEDDDVIVFHDISPQAPVHALVIPRTHVASLDASDEAQAELLGKLLLACRRAARELDVAGGYRVVTNVGPSAGQSVFHIHFHVLGGRALGWPPG